MNTERFLVVVCTRAFSSKGNTEVVRFGSISKIKKCKLRIKSEKTYFHLHERVGIESLSVFLFTCTCALRGVFSVPGVSSKQNPQAKEFGVGEGSGMNPTSECGMAIDSRSLHGRSSLSLDTNLQIP